MKLINNRRKLATAWHQGNKYTLVLPRYIKPVQEIYQVLPPTLSWKVSSSRCFTIKTIFSQPEAKCFQFISSTFFSVNIFFSFMTVHTDTKVNFKTGFSTIQSKKKIKKLVWSAVFGKRNAVKRNNKSTTELKYFFELTMFMTDILQKIPMAWNNPLDILCVWY